MGGRGFLLFFFVCAADTGASKVTVAAAVFMATPSSATAMPGQTSVSAWPVRVLAGVVVESDDDAIVRGMGRL